jgi:hypothetical protein
MAEYIEVADAIDRPGLRLVLSAGVPGPWGEAAKSLLYVKKIPYVKVRQYVALPNEELAEWTGRSNAPVAVYENEAPRDGWADILFLAERLAPEPRLIPAQAGERARMFGLAREVCGENGFAWLRRLLLIEAMGGGEGSASGPAAAAGQQLASRYGYSPVAAQSHPQSCKCCPHISWSPIPARRLRDSR